MARITCLRPRRNFRFSRALRHLARRLSAEATNREFSPQKRGQRADAMFDWPDGLGTPQFWRRAPAGRNRA